MCTKAKSGYCQQGCSSSNQNQLGRSVIAEMKNREEILLSPLVIHQFVFRVNENVSTEMDCDIWIMEKAGSKHQIGSRLDNQLKPL